MVVGDVTDVSEEPAASVFRIISVGINFQPLSFQSPDTDVDSVLALLDFVHVGDVTDVSEVHAASFFIRK